MVIVALSSPTSMPGADGFAVLTAARRVNPSATWSDDVQGASKRDQCGPARAWDQLTKPFSLQSGDVILRQAAARRSSQPRTATVRRDRCGARANRSRLASMEQQLTHLYGTTSIGSDRDSDSVAAKPSALDGAAALHDSRLIFRQHASAHAAPVLLNGRPGTSQDRAEV